MLKKPRRISTFKAGDRVKLISSKPEMAGEWLVVDKRSWADHDNETTVVVNVKTGKMWSLYNYRRAIKF